MDKCCFCGKDIDYKINGNDPRPIKVVGIENPICCNECNAKIVIPTRLALSEDNEAIQKSYEVLKQAYKMACNAVVAEHLPYAEIEEFKDEVGMEGVGIDNEDTELYFIYLADKEINGE